MSSSNSEINYRNKKQKPTQIEENSSMKIDMEKIGGFPSGDAKRDCSKSPTTKMIKVSESGDIDHTLYLTCTEFNTNKTSMEDTLAESTLYSTIAETTLAGSITNSSLDETLAESTYLDRVGDLTINSTFGELCIDKSPKKIIDQVEIITEPPNNNNNLAKELVSKESDKTAIIDNNATAFFSLTNVSNEIQSDAELSIDSKEEKPSDSKKNCDMFTEYRKNQSFNVSDTDTSCLLEDSKLEESWLYDRVVDTNDQEDLNEIELLMSNLQVSKRNDLQDEKERSLETVSQILENSGDEFGPDIATTNLLMMARGSLEMHLEIEGMYEEREKHARNIVNRRFHVSLEEFFDTINGGGIGKREGLDRYEKFLEDVDKSALERERRETIEKNLVEFNTFPILKNYDRPFRTQKEKHEYFLQTTLTALYMHAAKANKRLSKRRGYESV